MNKLFTLTLCGLLSISLVACGTNKPNEAAKNEISENIEIPDPFTECNSLEKAKCMK